MHSIPSLRFQIQAIAAIVGLIVVGVAIKLVSHARSK